MHVIKTHQNTKIYNIQIKLLFLRFYQERSDKLCRLLSTFYKQADYTI